MKCRLGMRYYTKKTATERREKRLAAQKRWKEKHRDEILRKKREYAQRAEVLERRRDLYRHRNDPTRDAPKTQTLDIWCKANGSDHG